MTGKPSARRIQVSLTLEEAESLLAFIPGDDGTGERLHDFHPNVLLHARGKLIGKLLDIPGYVPPTHRERVADDRA